MPSKLIKRGLAAALLASAFAGGCGSPPMAPGRESAFTVTLMNLNSLQASLLGSAQNEILFHLDGTGDPPGHGVYGPFSMAASTGSVTITVRVPSGAGSQVLSLQLNDAATHQPLALGAVGFDFGSGTAPGLAVTMGSVIRNCYVTDQSNPLVNTVKGSTYIFSSDTLTGGPPVLGGTDIAFYLAGGQYALEESSNAPGPTSRSIAYMGKGDMVDHDGVPPAADFFPYSIQSKAAAGEAVTSIELGDIYCVKAPSLNGGCAWMQITDPGVVNVRSPNFRFRVNSTLPYYAYELTTADFNGACGTTY